MKKILLIGASLLVILGASSLMADTDWSGTYWGTTVSATGTWQGVISDDQDPPRFKGEWISSDFTQKGTMSAILDNSEGVGIYTVLKGKIFDKDGNEIGAWNGYFNANVDPGYAEGKWDTSDPNQIRRGEWSGHLE